MPTLLFTLANVRAAVYWGWLLQALTLDMWEPVGRVNHTSICLVSKWRQTAWFESWFQLWCILYPKPLQMPDANQVLSTD